MVRDSSSLFKISINTGNGFTVSDGKMKQLEQIADKEILEFHEFLANSSIGNENNIDWWMTGYTSRNCFSSKLFFMLCSVLLVRDLARENNKFIIETDTYVLYKAFNKVLFREKSRAKVRYKIRPIKIAKLLYSMIIRPHVKLISYILRFLFARRKYSVNNCEENESITLMSSYAKPVFFNDVDDRYFPGISEYINDHEFSKILFLPRQYNVGLIDRIKEISLFRQTNRKVIIADDLLNINDYLFSWFHIFRLFVVSPKHVLWHGIDVRFFYYREAFFSYASAMDSLLYYRVILRLKKKGVKISRFINFTENQLIDKALHAAVRKYYPECVNIGYEGYSPVSKYYCSFPTTLEKNCGLLPDIFAIPGNDYRKWVLQFCNDASFMIAPHLRGKKIHEVDYTMQLKRDLFTILVAFSYFPEYVAEFIYLIDELLIEYGSKINIHVKLHPTMESDVLNKYMDLEENRVSLVDGDIYTQISRSDLLISNASGTVFDSIAMGIPVAQFVKDDSFFFNNIPGIVEAKNFHCFRNYRELSFYVSKLIDIHFSSEQFYARPDEKIIDQFYSKVTRSGVLKLLGIQE